MSWKIRYTSKWDGRTHEHVNSNSEHDARGWAESLSCDHGGRRAELVHVADGPYDHSGRETHVVTVGDDSVDE